MKIKESKVQDLYKLGFKLVSLDRNDPIYELDKDSSEAEVKEYSAKSKEFIAKNHVISDDEDTLFYYEGCFVYTLGVSRRGQFYFLIVRTDRTVSVLATKPDGDGSSANIDHIFSKLYFNGFVEDVKFLDSLFEIKNNLQ